MIRSSHVLARGLFAALLLGAGGASAEALAFVKASSELDDGRPRSYAFNLVDGKPTTSWCAKPTDGELKIVFGFKKAMKVTRLSVVAGSVRGKAFDARRKHARVLGVNDGNHMREIKLTEQVGAQTVTLDPPVEGRQFAVTVLNARGGEGPVCLGEITIKSTRGQLSGPSVGTKVRGLSTPARRMVHRWVDNVDAPERTLLLALDGTFTYRFEPLLEGKPVTLRGKWRGSHRWLKLEMGSKSFAMKKKMTRIDDGDQQLVQLSLKGKAPHPSLVSEFSPAPSPGL
jgi:hypothetical protein